MSEKTTTIEVLMRVAKLLLTSLRPSFEDMVVTLVDKALNKARIIQLTPRIIGLYFYTAHIKTLSLSFLLAWQENVDSCKKITMGQNRFLF